MFQTGHRGSFRVDTHIQIQTVAVSDIESGPVPVHWEPCNFTDIPAYM